MNHTPREQPRSASVEPGPKGWHSRGYVPHLDSLELLQHVTFRLADSLPLSLLRELEDDLQLLPTRRRVVERRKQADEALDAGHGDCALLDPRAASLVQGAFLHFDGVRYRLVAWVVMPNHVHVLLEPLAGWPLPRIVSSWKSFTGRRIAALVGAARSSAAPLRVWHREYWDRYIRDEGHLSDVVHYIHDNPVKAGLAARPEDWPWSSAGRVGGDRRGRAGLEPGGPGATLERGGPGGATAS